MSAYHVETQIWARWPRVLIVRRDGSTETRRYVPERKGRLTCRKDNHAGGWWIEYLCCGYRRLAPFGAEDVAEAFCPSCGARIVWEDER